MNVSGCQRPDTFRCPMCGCSHSIVKDSRPKGKGIERLRECLDGQHLYLTKEVITRRYRRQKPIIPNIL
jgi:transcriptional regulator NrdR family protein